jgi:dienelactone hydrolase
MVTRENVTLVGKSISVDVYQKGATPPRTAVIVAYGTEGMNPPFNSLIEDFCKAMATAGYLTILPFYFQSTGTTAGTSAVVADLNKSGTWIDTLTASIDWVTGKISGSKVALVGFSLGANMVINAALKKQVTAVVDYFGPVDQFGILPMPPAMRLTKQRVQSLPPVLIHHGNRDIIVPDTQSQHMKGWLSNNCQFFNDYDCGHPGQLEGQWTTAAQKKSVDRTIAFLAPLL